MQKALCTTLLAAGMASADLLTIEVDGIADPAFGKRSSASSSSTPTPVPSRVKPCYLSCSMPRLISTVHLAVKAPRVKPLKVL